jgi:tetraacyldisaccharide 4'-kinase
VLRPARDTGSRILGVLQTAWLTRGPLAWALLPVAGLYALLSAGRRVLFRTGCLAIHRLEVPVVVVGNLLVGGVGKTPTVIAVVALLRRHGYTPAIVSRGYGRRGVAELEVHADTPASDCGDEPKLLLLRTGAPVIVGRDRVKAARQLLRCHPEVDVLVSDDGLQHLALGRSAQVIVFDERGVGNGFLLPAGPLRETLSHELPARSVVLYNAAAPATHWPGSLARRALAGIVELGAWRQGAVPCAAALQSLRGRRFLAAAGIGRPERFFEMLREQGLQFDTLLLPDHFSYSELPWPTSAADVVVTEKDAVKIEPQRLGVTRVWVAALDLRTEPGFDSALLALLPPARAVSAAH